MSETTGEQRANGAANSVPYHCQDVHHHGERHDGSGLDVRLKKTILMACDEGTKLVITSSPSNFEVYAIRSCARRGVRAPLS